MPLPVLLPYSVANFYYFIYLLFKCCLSLETKFVILAFIEFVILKPLRLSKYIRPAIMRKRAQPIMNDWLSAIRDIIVDYFALSYCADAREMKKIILNDGKVRMRFNVKKFIFQAW